MADEIPNCPPFSDADLFIVAESPGINDSPYKVRKQLVNPGNASNQDAVAPEDSEIYVHYEVFDSTGELHDSSRQRDFPFHFTLGETHAGPLWTAAIRSMIPGEKAIFHCHANQLYQPFKMPTTLKNSHEDLNVHVEYLYWDDWSNVVYDGRIKKKRLDRGSKEIATPNDGSNVTVRYTGKLLNGPIFDKTEDVETFTLCKKDIIEGLELAIKSMCRGEKSLFQIDSSYAWGATGDSNLNVPARATVQYEVHLIDYSAGTLQWEMSAEEKAVFAQHKKEFGNNAFKLGNLDRATRLYQQALELIQYEGNNNIPQQAKQIKLDCLNNLCILKMKLGDYGEAISFASKVLELDQKNPKALYRRAQCYMKTGQPDLALIDVEAALTFDSHSEALASMHFQCKQAIKKANQKTAARFGGWCDRVNLAETSDESAPGSTYSESADKPDA